MSRIAAWCEWLLRQPIVWGCMACFAFYVLVVQNVGRDGALYHCFAGHNQQFKVLAAVLFFTALAALGIKLFGVVVQYGAMAGIELPPAPADGQPVEDVDHLQSQLGAAPAALHSACLTRRLQHALMFVKQRRGADRLESHLHRLEDADLRRIEHSHAAVRLIAVAILVVGLVGTVMGAPLAIERLADAKSNSVQTSLAGVSIVLEPALQSLLLCMMLAVARFAVERVELRLASAVSENASRQLLGRFRQLGADTDPHVASIRRISEKSLESIDAAIQKHEQTLARTIGAAGRRWEEMASAAAAAIHRSVGEALAAGIKQHAQSLNEGVVHHASNLEGTLIRHAEILGENIDHHTAALADALEHHSVVLAETEKSLAAENQSHLANMASALGEAMLVAATRQEKLIEQSEQMLMELRAALVEAAGTTVSQQEQLIKQSDVLLRVVEATGQIRMLEDSLNRNLASLAASHNFEQTAVSLAAAVQLLAARLQPQLRLHDEISLGDDDFTSQAA